MSDSNLTKHPEFVHIGPCTFGLYDDTNDLLYVIGKVDNIRFSKLDPSPVFLTEILNGQEVETLARDTACKFRMKGKFTETLDPNTHYMVLKNCGTPTLAPDCSIDSITEVHQVFKGRSFLVRHNNGFYGSNALPGIENLITDDLAWTGSGITPRTYTVIVVPVYGGTEGASEESTIAVGADEALAVTWDPPIGGIPASYNLYVYHGGQTSDDAYLIGSVGGTATSVIYIDALQDLGDYPGEMTGSFTITDMSDSPYISGTDYILDGACGAIAIPSTSAIEDGTRTKVTYSWRTNPSVTMSIGPNKTNSNPRLYHPVLISTKDDDRNPPNARGIQIDLWKVMGSSGFEWDLSSLNFDSGFEFEWPVLIDEAKLNHGEITSFNRHFEAYEIVDWSTLAKWGSAVSCEDET